MLETAKKQLDKKVPLVLDGICIDKENGECKSYHSVVLAGYKKVCRTKNTADGNCRTLFKIQNSWGQDWQKRYNDGWVDGATLMAEIPGNGALSWYK